MFSYEERLKGIRLLLQYNMSYSTVIRELGYLPKESLGNWFMNIEKKGNYIGILLKRLSI